VLVLAGSGPVDRDGNLPGWTNDSLKLVAQQLANRGFISLRVDKRGIGESRLAGPREEDLRFNTYVTDALTWLQVLRAEPRVSCTFLLGHSEGGLIATLVARKTDVAGLVIVAGAGEPVGRLIERQLALANVPNSLQVASQGIVATLEAGQTAHDVPAELASLFRLSVQPYLSSWLGLDPGLELAHVTVPVLIVQGTNDLQVTVADAYRLKAANPQAKLRLVEGMNHILKQAAYEREANLATYADPRVPLSPELIPLIEEFLNQDPSVRL
jgi:alpha-beta hydrolase superfamily lysophospholipase